MGSAGHANGVNGHDGVNGTNGANGAHESSSASGLNKSSNSTKPPEPIAIIGLSCKFPGDASHPEAFWNMLEAGVSAWSAIPRDRFNAESFHHPQGGRRSTTNAEGAHFLKGDIDRFDAPFFNFSTEVAASLDPQCRLMFEAAYEALENAGIPLEKAAGSNTSVYASSFFRDFLDGYARDPQTLPRYVLTGNGSSMLSNRLSHWFDLKGPSLTVDTGCSSGLTALHLACQSLRTGESTMGLVGGANLMLNPDVFILLSSLGMLSSAGRCYAFDSRASGYGRGEGVGLLVLKTLKSAIADGDTVRAIIRESTLNQDGRTPTITSPSQDAQMSLMRKCIESAKLDPLDIQYVEAHGTGTQVGDVTEATSIASIFAKDRPETNPLLIGSVKTNIGHLEPASGFASIIKMVLAFEHDQIPPSANFESPNAKLDLNALRLKVPSIPTKWPEGKRRLASINNFGYGGTNAHVIMEGPEHVSRDNSNGSTPSQHRKVFVIHGKDEAATNRNAERLCQHLVKAQLGEDDATLDNLAYTLSKRSAFEYTTAVSAQSKSELISALADEDQKPVSSLKSNPRLGFVFTGQGAQWYAMGRELIDAYPVFKRSLVEADRYLKEFGAEYSLIEELCKDEDQSNVNDPILSPPLCVAVQIALVRLLESWSIKPAAVTSHSSGEIAAAYASGAITLKDAMYILYTRGVFLHALRKKSTTKGSMIAVGLGQESAQSWINEVDPDNLVIACVNSPSSVTVSGNFEAVTMLGKKLSEAKIFARKLKVDVAYHSWHLEPLRAQYLEALLAGLEKPKASQAVKYTSPVSGSLVSDSHDLDAAHWVKNMMQPVLFSEALTAMCTPHKTREAQGGCDVDILVEIGPHSALAGPIRQTLSSQELKGFNIEYKSALIRDKDAVETVQALASFLLAKGCQVDLQQVNFPSGTPKLKLLQNLPTYSWNHDTRYWDESRLNKAHRMRKHPVHDILGALVPGENIATPIWRHIIRATELPWVHDHIVQGDIIYPGAGYLCMAIEGAAQIADQPVKSFTLEDVDILDALVVPNDSAGVEVRLYFKPYDENDPGKEGSYSFSIFSVPDQETWTEHCRGRISCAFFDEDAGPSRLHTIDTPGGFSRHINPSSLYKSLQAVGINHGPQFQNLLSLTATANRSSGSFRIADVRSNMPGQQQAPHIMHPTTLDSIFLATYSALPNAGTKTNSAMVPKTLKRLVVSSAILSDPGTTYQFQVNLHKSSIQGFEASVSVTDQQNDCHLSVDNLFCKSLGMGASAEEPTQLQNKALTIHWADDLIANETNVLKPRLLFPPVHSEMALVGNLRRACYYLIHDALQELTATDVEQLQWHHKAMYHWMQDQEELAKTNKIAADSDSWQHDRELRRREVIERASRDSVDGQMAVRVGKALVPIFRQQIAPLELMLEEKLLYAYYKGSLRMDRSYEQIKQLVGAFAHKVPRAKILEIGGGTGGCTVNALGELGGGYTGKALRFGHYTFTDISSGFFEMAKEQFGSWGDLVSYAKLDIEKDTAGQGFEDGTYDLIIACQVLHATKNMERTMSNVRRLLKPGGKLMMVETTNDAIDMQIIFGTVPGWWLSEETERKSSPNLSLDMWGRVLKATGFSGLDLAVRDSETEQYALSVLMSTAVAANTASPDAVILPLHKATNFSTLNQLERLLSSKIDCSAAIKEIDQEFSTEGICIIIDDGPSSVLKDIDAALYEQLRKTLLNAPGVLWVSRGSTGDCETPFSSLSTGLLRSLRCENSQTKYISLDLDPSRKEWAQECSDAVTRVFKLSFGNPSAEALDSEYRERKGLIQVPRIQENQRASEAFAETMPIIEKPFFQDNHIRLVAQTPGTIESLVFEEVSSNSDALPENHVEIEPAAFGLNFRDVMVALDQLDLSIMGLECSGTITKVGPKAGQFHIGDRVCGLLRGHWSNRVTIDCDSIVPMPKDMDFETAASIPLVFATAYYGIIHQARLEEGETVLIHNAAGGVGQAAIMLAKHVGAEIFVTAGTPEKREFIRTTFGIPATHIFSNRDSSFSTSIQAITKGKGVDVVLNSLAGRLLVDTWKCIGAFGRFVEIGKRDLESNHNLEMEPFTRNVTFHSVDLILLGENRPRIIAKIMGEIMQLIEEKRISPITPLSVYELPQVIDAFKLMRAGKHLGKMVVRTDKRAAVPTLLKKQSATLRKEATYVVVGGSTGLGQGVCRLLIERGATHLIILSRAAQSRKYIDFYAELRAAGCEVVARNCDVANLSQLQEVLRQCANMPPIKGVVQGAMVLEDSIFETLTHSAFQKAIGPKVHGSWNLHTQFFADNGYQLDFFIMLSSLTGALGNSSQSNYAAGGTFQDALARYRASQGLPAVSLDLGMVRSFGYVANNEGAAKRLQKIGYTHVEDAEVLGLIEDAISSPIRNPENSQVLIGIPTGPGADWGAAPWRHDARLAGLRQEMRSASDHVGGKAGSGSVSDVKKRLTSATGFSEASTVVGDVMSSKVAEMFSLPAQTIDQGMKLAQLGLDSLVAVELRNWLSHVLQAQLSIFEIMQSASLGALGEKVVRKSRLVDEKVKS